MTPIAISTALLVVPALVGWLTGLAIRRARRGRSVGIVWLVALLTVVLAAAIALDAYTFIVGIWDALSIAAVLVAGLLVALHRVFADPRNVLVAVVATVFACLLLEPFCRFLLPPPSFPSPASPSLLIADALRASSETEMSTTVSQAIACEAIYKTELSEWTQSAPYAQNFRPRANVKLHVLHIGDSILYGGVGMRFTSDLNALEPDVEHINAATCATATDAQLAIIRRWVALQPIDAVVMHLNPNDSLEIDAPFPCSDWKSLMVYSGGAPQLRYATAHTPDPEEMRVRLLLQNSPPPYLLRAAVRFSAAAADLAAASVFLGRRLAFAFDRDELRGQAHIKACLLAVRDELSAHHIPLVVDILHWQHPVEERQHDNEAMKATAEDLGLVILDSYEPLVQALDRGEQPFADVSGHLTLAGHAAMAKWLHQELPAAIEQALGR